MDIFWSEKKTLFLVPKGLPLTHKKQNSKNILIEPLKEDLIQIKFKITYFHLQSLPSPISSIIATLLNMSFLSTVLIIIRIKAPKYKK